MLRVELATSSDQMQRVLVRASAEINRPEVPLKRAGVYMLSSIDRNFQAQGRPVQWPGLSLMTIQLRQHKGSAGVFRILEDTGRLRKSMTMTLAGDKSSVKVGTSFPYARLLQFGGAVRTPAFTIVPRKAKALRFDFKGKTFFTTKVFIPSVTRKIPPRPFIIVQDPEDVEVIHQIFADHVDEALKKS